MKIRTVIVEDQILLTAAYKSLLLSNDNIEIIGQATCEEEAIHLINETKPDVVLMDVQLGNGSGISVTKAVQKTSPNTRILGLSQHKDLSIVHKMMQAGASGFITKTSNPNDLADGIINISNGESFFCSSLKEDYSRLILNPKLKDSYTDLHFTEREKQIIKFIAEGKTPDEIATKLDRSKRTVEVYLGRIYKKLGINKVIHLASWAKKNPWINL